MKPLKPMIWKELRENAQWAMLAMTAVALFFGVAVSNLYYLHDPSWVFSQPIFPPQTAIYAPLVGLMLGFLQIAPELRRDQWAFLMHRPASRAAMFWGKVIPGVILYTLALGIPLLGVGCWVFTHSNIIVPFSWRMVAPNLADMLLGLQFYFAAILIAVRPAHWYGSKAIAAAAAVLAISIIYRLGDGYLSDFWQEALISSLILAVFVVAAQSCFVSFGHYESQKRLGRLALGTVFLTGLLALGGVLVLCIISAANIWSPPPLKPKSIGEPRATPHTWPAPVPYTRYFIDAKARVLKVTRLVDFKPNSKNITVKIETLDGRVIDSRKSGHTIEDPISLNLFRLDSPLDLGQEREFVRTSGYRNLYANFVAWGSQDVARKLQWFYSDYEHRFIAYSLPDGKRIGYLGPGGFYTVAAAPPLAQARFPGPLLGFTPNNLQLARCQNTYYWIDPLKQTVTPVTADLPGHHIRSFDASYTSLNDDTMPLIVLTDGTIEFFDKQRKTQFSTPIEHHAPDYILSVGVTRPDHRIVLDYWPVPQDALNGNTAARPQLPQYVTILSSTGRVLQHYTLPHLPRPTFPRFAAAPDPKPDLEVTGWLGWTPCIAGATAPLVGTLVAAKIFSTTLYSTLSKDSGDHDPIELDYAQRVVGLMLWLGLASSILCTILAFFVAHRCAFTTPGYASWMIGVFLLGPVGLLLMLALNEWPARVTCASCGQRRDVHREFCEHCAAPFPPPIPDGTEIFEPVGLFAT